MNLAEFKRNILLEINPLKLFLAPFLIGLILITYYMGKDYSIDPYFINTIIKSCAFGMFFLGGIWGVKKSIESLSDEMSMNTFFFQRNIGYKPFDFLIGKVFGATSYNWYCFLILASILVGHSFFVPEQRNYKDYTSALVLYDIVILFCICVSAQLMAHLTAQLMYINIKDHTKVKSGSLLILNIIIVSVFAVVPFKSEFHFVYSKELIWYGLSVNVFQAMIINCIYFMVWLFLGVHHCYHLLFGRHIDKKVWSLFLVITPLYFLGYEFSGNLSKVLQLSGFTYLCIIYVCFIAKSWDTVEIKKILRICQSRKFLDLPYFIYPAIGYLAVFCLLLVMQLTGGSENTSGLSGIIFPLLVILFVIRDLGIYLYLELSNKIKRSRSILMIFAALLYGILPFFFGSIYLPLKALFIPDHTNLGMSFVSIVIQVIIVVVLLNKKKPL
jgi:hypothetical protein